MQTSPLPATRSRGLGRAALMALIVTVSGCGSDPVSESAGQPVETVDVAETGADDIPVAHTPPGGWTEMPPPVLATCTEPLVAGAVDMRGSWKVVQVEADGVDDPDHKIMGEEQRIEQCGDRVVITAGGIVHDMRADGTEKGGVHDVAAANKSMPITVIASFEAGVHVLRPVGLPVEIRRRIEGEQLVWDYAGFTARLDRVKTS